VKLTTKAKELATTSTTEEVPAATNIPADEVSLKKKSKTKPELKSKAERKEAGAQKWSEKTSEANQAIQARAEKSEIYQDESLSEQAKKG
jgi:hypothetical protein